MREEISLTWLSLLVWALCVSLNVVCGGDGWLCARLLLQPESKNFSPVGRGACGKKRCSAGGPTFKRLGEFRLEIGEFQRSRCFWASSNRPVEHVIYDYAVHVVVLVQE